MRFVVCIILPWIPFMLYDLYFITLIRIKKSCDDTRNSFDDGKFRVNFQSYKNAEILNILNLLKYPLS